MIRSLWHRFLGAFLGLALVFSGVWGAHAHQLPDPASLQLQAFLLAGGDLAAICGDDQDGHAGMPPDCPLCHLASAVVLPDPVVTLADAELRMLAEVVAPRESRAIRAPRDPGRETRGPPLG